MGSEEEIKKIEEEITKTTYNKATQKHIGILKAKLAKLKAGAEKSGGKKGQGYSVKKTGDATVLLVGFPSVGKSTLLNKITNADSKVGAYDFTTLDVVPGILEYNSAKIQILDVPGIIEGVSGGKGRGKEILSVVRTADLVLIMASADKIERQLTVIENELYSAGFRLNQKPPDINISRKSSGGIRISSTVNLKHLNRETIISILNTFSIHNAEVLIRENADQDRFIDALMKNRVYVPYLKIINKIDITKPKNHDKNTILISAKNEKNLEEIKERIWENLGLLRIYLKRIGKEPDMKEPLIMHKGINVLDVCKKIHKVFAKDFRYARVWGSSRFPGQKVGNEFKVKDKDIVELHL